MHKNRIILIGMRKEGLIYGYRNHIIRDRSSLIRGEKRNPKVFAILG